MMEARMSDLMKSLEVLYEGGAPDDKKEIKTILLDLLEQAVFYDKYGERLPDSWFSDAKIAINRARAVSDDNHN